MNVCEREHMAAMDNIMVAPDRNSVDEAGKKGMLAIACSLKDEIIHL